MKLPYEKLLALSKKTDEQLATFADGMEMTVTQVRKAIDNALEKIRRDKERNAITALSVKYCKDNGIIFKQKDIDSWITKNQ